MPVSLKFPGVYIQEIPSGVRTITGVATSIAAFVGRALRGPLNDPVTIQNFGDFERIFGGLWLESTLGYAVRDFYLNGGGTALIVRLFHPDFGSKEAEENARAAAVTVAAAANRVNSRSTATAVVEAAVTAAEAFTTEPEKAGAAAVVDAAQAALSAGGSNDTVTKAALAARDALQPTSRAVVQVGTIKLEAAHPGSWGNQLKAAIDRDVKPSDDAEQLFNLSVTDTPSGQVELFRNVSTASGHPRRLDRVLEQDSQLVRVADPATMPATRPEKAEASSVTAQSSDGATLNALDFLGSQDEKRGIFALEHADLFNLLCIPPHKDDGDTDSQVLTVAVTYCKKRRAMLIVDPPAAWTSKKAAVDGVSKLGITNPNAALFFPRLRQPNLLRDGQVEVFAPCGTVAGVFARTDADRGVWKAPAGLSATLKGTNELSVPLTDGENGELNPLGVNCLRTMPAAGAVVWGARTMEGDDRLASEWKYIPVRRTALFIEESLYRGTQFVVFEPNDEALWGQIRLNVGAFMQSLFRQGAFQGSSASDAYFVKVDAETTTQNDIDRGIVNIVVGFAPLKPAEFVIISLQQMAGQLET